MDLAFSVEFWAAFSDFILFYFIFLPAVLFDQVNHEQCTHALFTDPQIPLFNNFFIKNRSHDTNHTFKNYFVTVFSISAKISSIQTDPISHKHILLNGSLTNFVDLIEHWTHNLWSILNFIWFNYNRDINFFLISNMRFKLCLYKNQLAY